MCLQNEPWPGLLLLIFYVSELATLWARVFTSDAGFIFDYSLHSTQIIGGIQLGINFLIFIPVSFWSLDADFRNRVQRSMYIVALLLALFICDLWGWFIDNWNALQLFINLFGYLSLLFLWVKQTQKSFAQVGFFLHILFLISIVSISALGDDQHNSPEGATRLQGYLSGLSEQILLFQFFHLVIERVKEIQNPDGGPNALDPEVAWNRKQAGIGLLLAVIYISEFITIGIRRKGGINDFSNSSKVNAALSQAILNFFFMIVAYLLRREEIDLTFSDLVPIPYFFLVIVDIYIASQKYHVTKWYGIQILLDGSGYIALWLLWQKRMPQCFGMFSLILHCAFSVVVLSLSAWAQANKDDSIPFLQSLAEQMLLSEFLYLVVSKVANN